MKVTHWLIITIGILTVTGCKHEQPATFCDAPELIAVQSTCYNPTNGLVLQASNYGSPDQPIQFNWTVYIQKDTSTAADLSVARVKTIASNDMLTLPDSVLKTDGKLVVKIATTCAGKATTTDYYAFVKRLKTSSSCYQWERQKI